MSEVDYWRGVLVVVAVALAVGTVLGVGLCTLW